MAQHQTVSLEQFDDGWAVRYWTRRDGQNEEVKVHAPNARAVATILQGIRPEPPERAFRWFQFVDEPQGDEEPKPDEDCFVDPPPLAAAQADEAFAPPGDHNVAVDDTRGGL